MAKPSLTDLTTFAAVARHRSFRAAADELGVSRSSLSHAIGGLEQQLGIRLLHRTTRSVAPTEAGASLLARLVPTLRDLDDMLAVVSDGAEGPAGTVRINVLGSAARWLLGRVIPDFLRRYPRVSIDMVTEDRLIAIPFGGDVRFLAVAAPGYVSRHGVPATPDDLRQHRCIRQRLASGKPYRWEFARGQDEIAMEVPGSLTLNHNELMAEAAAEGLGIAYVPERVARPFLDDGRLCALLEDWCPAIPGLCLYYPGHRHVPPALRVFIDDLRAADALARSA